MNAAHKPRVFVTGGSGFVGRRLLDALADSGKAIVALDRSGRIQSRAAMDVVRGDLLEPSTYREALSACDVVVHLAAATGRAHPEAHDRVNALGTRTLVETARQAGVTRFLFVSSIAVTFPDLRGYPYAETKARAEAAVQASGLEFLILRPTMILGPGSDVFASLEKLATLPVAIVPGSGSVPVQPIHVQDVVRAIEVALEAPAFPSEIVELGGRETLAIKDLLRRIRMARLGKPGPILRVPLAALQIPLRLAESVGLRALLPTTAGQLSSFRFSGVARRGWLQDSAPPQAGLEDMVAVQRETRPPDLATECGRLSRNVIGVDADSYVQRKYATAHDALTTLHDTARFDRFLVQIAIRGRVLAWLADGYTGAFARTSLLRKKLVLLLAILESSRPSYKQIDAPLGAGTASSLIRLIATGAGAVVAAVAGAIVLTPIRVFFGPARGGRQ